MADEPNYEALRLAFARLRSGRGLTYERLSELSGVSRATLIAMETATPRSRNSGRPASRGSLESWWRVARAFDMPVGELLRALDDR